MRFEKCVVRPNSRRMAKITSSKRRPLIYNAKTKGTNVSWTHLEDKRPKARKPHRCYLCGLPIRVGTTHLARSGVGDGGFSTVRMHESCNALTADWDELDWECCGQGDLDLSDCDPVTVAKDDR